MDQQTKKAKAEAAAKALSELLACGGVASVDRGVLGRALMVVQEIRDEEEGEKC